MAHLNEQLQQELSRKDQELKETKETHQSQISSLQEKIVKLVSHVEESQIIISITICCHLSVMLRNSFIKMSIFCLLCNGNYLPFFM